MNQSPNQGAGTPIDEPQDANFNTPPVSPARAPRECPGAPARNGKRSRDTFGSIDNDIYEPKPRLKSTGTLLSSDPLPRGFSAKQQPVDAQRKTVAETLTQQNDQANLPSTYLVSYSELGREVAKIFKARATEGSNPCANEVYQPWKPSLK